MFNWEKGGAAAPATAADVTDPDQQQQQQQHGNGTPLAPVQSAAEAVRDIKSPGVKRMEAIASVITLKDRIGLFIGVFIVAYAYGLDATLRTYLQLYATGDLGDHALTSTVNVMRGVLAAASQPTAAKIADVFGRVEVLIGATVFYIVGTIIEATAQNITTLTAGVAIYIIGYTVVIMLLEVIIADITSTRSRVFFSYVPALPFIINTWISGDVLIAINKTASWRWGYGMWCIIFPICAVPLGISLTIISVRARRRGLLDDYTSSLRVLGAHNFAVELFWMLDVIGIILVIAVFALLLIPLTIAGGVKSTWGTAHVIAPLVIGFCCIPVFVWWELRAPHPLVPFTLMKDRGVFAPIFIAILLNFAWVMQGDYLYTVLFVGFGFDEKLATRVSGLYSFVSVVVGPLLGLLIYYMRRLKILVVCGTALFMVAFGLLIHFRGAHEGSTSAKIGVIAAEVVLGIAGGMFPYPAQASMQVQLKHENLAVMTGIYLAVYNIGSALGNAVSGALWTQLLPGYLERGISDPKIVAAVYADPLVNAIAYPMGSPTRTAIVNAYRDIQKILCITGLCLCVPLIAFALLLRNPVLTDEQTLAEKIRVSSDEDDEEERARR